MAESKARQTLYKSIRKTLADAYTASLDAIQIDEDRKEYNITLDDLDPIASAILDFAAIALGSLHEGVARQLTQRGVPADAMGENKEMADKFADHIRRRFLMYMMDHPTDGNVIPRNVRAN